MRACQQAPIPWHPRRTVVVSDLTTTGLQEATMRKMIGLLAALVAIAAGPADAQPLRPGTPSILRWTLEQQIEWYPAIETVYRTAIVKRGDYVRPLPKADRAIDNLAYT